MPDNPDSSAAAVAELVANFDHHCPAFSEHRTEFYAAIHGGCPALHSDLYGGFHYFARYETVLDVQRDTETFSNRQLTIPLMAVPPMIPASVDPPAQPEFKRLLTPFFSPQAIAARMPRISELVERLIGAGVDKGEFDIVVDCMQPLVGVLTTEILGLDGDKAHVYARTIHNASLLEVPREEARRQMHALLEDVRGDVIALRGGSPALIGQIGRADFMGSHLSDEQLAMITLNLLTGGLATTPMFTGSVVVFLGRHPGHKRQLIERPALIPNAFEELLRTNGPVQTFVKTAAIDTVVDGVRLAAGEAFLVGYGAANFDPDQFPAPETVDFDRTPNRHTSMGIGPHRCLGVHLAKAVVCRTIEYLLEQAPDYRLIEDGLGPYQDIATKLGYYSVPIAVR